MHARPHLSAQPCTVAHAAITRTLDVRGYDQENLVGTCLGFASPLAQAFWFDAVQGSEIGIENDTLALKQKDGGRDAVLRRGAFVADVRHRPISR